MKKFPELLKEQGLDVKEYLMLKTKEGLFPSDIAALWGLSRSTICHYAKEHGIVMRLKPSHKHRGRALKVNPRKT